FFFHGLRVTELTAFGEIKQSLIWNAAPQEEGQPRSNLEIAKTVDGFTLLNSLTVGTVHTQKEVRIDKEPFERKLNASIESSTVFTSVIEELDQRLHILRSHGPPIRQTRHFRKNLHRAAVLFGHRLFLRLRASVA